MADKKSTFALIGPKTGLPSFEDILKLTKSLSGRDATPEEVEAARKVYATLGKKKPAAP